jgi:hypothetical protein
MNNYTGGNMTIDWRQLNITIEDVIDAWEECYYEDLVEDYPALIINLIERGRDE